MESASGAEGEVVMWVIAVKWQGTTRQVTTPPLEEETTGRLKGTVQEVPVGQGAKGPDRLRAPRGDLCGISYGRHLQARHHGAPCFFSRQRTG